MRARALVVRSGVGVCGAPHLGWEGRCSVETGQGGACRVPLGLSTVGACVAGAAPTVDNPGVRRIRCTSRQVSTGALKNAKRSPPRQRCPGQEPTAFAERGVLSLSCE